MDKLQQLAFHAPTPGYGLTQPPGSMPFSKPPQYADPKEAVQKIADSMLHPKKSAALVFLVKGGLPLEAITSYLLFNAVSDGRITPDTALLIYKSILATLAGICEKAGVTSYKVMKSELMQDKLEEIVKDETTVEEVADESEDKPKASFISLEE